MISHLFKHSEVPKLSLSLRSSWCKPGHFIVVYGNTLFIRNKVLSQKLNITMSTKTLWHQVSGSAMASM